MRNGKLVAYSGMTTKIRAMKKGLISQSEYDEIANLKTVPDLISYLVLCHIILYHMFLCCEIFISYGFGHKTEWH